MSDVNDTAEAPVAPVEETTAPDAQVNETTEQKVEAPVEKTIPYSRFAEVNKGYREAQRKLAELESKSKLSQFDPNDMEAIMAHPYVQEMAIKLAKTELTNFASDLLAQHPEIPEAVVKAIKTNVRGFVKESTTDVEAAKIDIQEYIEGLLEGVKPTQPAQKVIPVASTTPKESPSGATPMEVQAILETPLDEWTEEQIKTVDNYKKSQPKR